MFDGVNKSLPVSCETMRGPVLDGLQRSCSVRSKDQHLDCSQKGLWDCLFLLSFPSELYLHYVSQVGVFACLLYLKNA